MATTGTAALSNEVKALYDGDFYLQGQSMVYFDQFCDLRKVMNGERGITYNFPLISSLQPSPTPLDELQDVPAQQMRASEIQITLQEFGSAIEVTKFAVATVYSDVYKQAAYVNGYNLAESFDYVARAVFGQGSRRFFINNRVSRATIDGQGTAADRNNPGYISLLGILARATKMPLYEDGALVIPMHPFAFYDFQQSPLVANMGTYSHPELLFNGEIAYWGGMRIIMTANAKAFWGQGAAAASAVATTLAASVAIGATSFTVASATNIAVGQWLSIIDAAETGNTWSDTNELFFVTSIVSTTVTGFVLDPGPDGGFRYFHASGKTVSNANAVYPLVCIGPNSVTKAASSLTGPYGETVVTGPFDRLGRFLNFGWYAIVGYGRTQDGWLFRGEVGSSIV